jgi:hypothetical protein
MVQDRVEVEIGDGEFVIEPIDLRVRNQGFGTYRAACGDPGSASGEVVWEFALSRGDLARAHPNSNPARLGPGVFFHRGRAEGLGERYTRAPQDMARAYYA